MEVPWVHVERCSYNTIARFHLDRESLALLAHLEVRADKLAPGVVYGGMKGGTNVAIIPGMLGPMA